MPDPDPRSPLVPAPRPGSPVSSIVARAQTEQEIVTQIERMPALPSVVAEVLRLTRDEASCARDLQRIIRQDQVLIGRILKLVNSSFYGRLRRISSIQEAIVTLGYATIKNVVVAASATKLFNKPMDVYGFEPLGLWKHSIACAIAAKRIAESANLGPELANETFLGGLLHDIGKIILADFLRPHAAAVLDLCSSGAATLLEAEVRLVGFDHPQVGLRVSKRWNFPAQVDEVIRAHHGPELATQFPKHAAVVHIANILVKAMGVGLIAGSDTREPLSLPALQLLGLQPEDQPRLQGLLAAESEQIKAYCEALTT